MPPGVVPLSRRLGLRAVKAASHLLQDPNILGLGIGRKRVSGTESGTEAIIVKVTQKADRSEDIMPGYRVPPRIPVHVPRGKGIVDIATDVVESLPKHLATNAGFVGGPGRAVAPEGGHGAGTYGATVRDADGIYYALSCNHVLTAFGTLAIGHEVVATDATGHTRSIGRVVRVSRMRLGGDNSCDAGLVYLDDAQSVDGKLPSGRRITGMAPRFPRPGDRVKMEGAVSGAREGRVRHTEVTERVFGWNGEANYVWLEDQIEVEGLGVRGDSGAIIIDAQDRGVAMFVADDGYIDLATPLKKVLGVLQNPGECLCESPAPKKLNLYLI